MTIKTTLRGGADSNHPNGRMDYPHPKVSPGKFTREDNMRLDKEYGTDPRSPLHTNNRFGKDHPSLQDDWDGVGENAIWEDMPNGQVKNRISGETTWP